MPFNTYMPLNRQPAISKREANAYVRYNELRKKNSELQRKNKKLENELKRAKNRLNTAAYVRRLALKRANLNIPSVRAKWNLNRKLANLRR